MKPAAAASRFHFSTGRPIERRDEDLLGRLPFAEQLAAAIKSWTGQDSLVVGVYGSWGSGKSSVKNLVVASLDSGEAAPRVVEFNPWAWSGQDQLGKAFFQEIGKQLGRGENTEVARESAKKWRAYAAALGIWKTVFAGIRPAVQIVAGVFLFLGLGGAFLTGTLSRIASAVIAIASAIILGAESLVNRISEYLSAKAEVESKSLPEIKRDLADTLRAAKKPLLVVIDDVDRLASHEVKFLFQLVKINADLPNIVYLMLMQRDVVEEMLKQELRITDSREYLKKIIQIEFDLPLVERAKVERVLFAKIDNILEGLPIEGLWKQARWTDLFIAGLRPYFGTLRDVYRLVSSLSFQVAYFSKAKILEVNPIDLIAIEVLRVFEPEIFNLLPPRKELLTTNRDTVHARGTSDSKDKREIEDDLLSSVKVKHPDAVKEILKQTFLPIAWALGGSVYGADSMDHWYRERRPCHPDVFDKYFLMAIPEGDVSHEEIEKLASLAGNREGLVAQLESLAGRGLMEVALDRLESYSAVIDLEHRLPFVCALMDFGDELPTGRLGLADIPPVLEAARIIFFYLRREPSLEVRGNILTECVRETRGVYLPCFMVALEGDKVREKRTDDMRLANDQALSELRTICASKVSAAGETSKLSKSPHLAELLGFWRLWGTPDEARSWVSRFIGTTDGLLAFLVAFTGEARSYPLGSSGFTSHWQINLKVVEEYADVELIEAKLQEIGDGQLDEERTRSVKAFRKAIKDRKEGKSDFPPWHNDSESE